MTAKLFALVVALLAAVHGHVAVAGAAVSVQALVLIVLLAFCAGLGVMAARVVSSFRSSPAWRP
jgi:hypothetical protein